MSFLNSNYCDHCQLEVVVPYKIKGNEQYSFCCAGCRNVFQILHDQGLDKYYKLKGQGHFVRPAMPAIYAADVHNKSYLYFDNDSFRSDYLASIETDDSEFKYFKIKLYLEGVHCLACLWLIEGLSDFFDEIKESRLDLGKSVVEITFREDFKISKIAQTLTEWGYRPHPIGFKSDANKVVEDLALKEERTMLKRIGVAAFGAGNIMIYAVSLYGGADGQMANFFGLITLALALPVFLYSAVPFYKSALSNLRTRTISIDLPIAFALIVGGGHGTYNALTQNPHNYFDTLTILVFLLLFSRYAVKKMGQTGLDRNLMRSFFNSGEVLRKNNRTGQFESLSSEYLNVGDVIKVCPGETLKADIKVIYGVSAVNKSTLTGEALPVHVKPGDSVESGCINNSADLIGEVQAVGEKTLWGETLYKIEKGWAKKSPIVRQMDLVAQRLVLVVFFTALGLFSYFYLIGDSLEGLERALALIIITCPCALGLATPLAMTRALSQSAFQGIIVKDEEVFERLAKIDSIALDKTGTITSGQIEVLNWPATDSKLLEKLFGPIAEKPLFLEALILEIERHSSHPVAEAFKNYCQRKIQESPNVKTPQFKLENKNEIFGFGTKALLNGVEISLGKSQELEDFDNELNSKDPLEIKVELRFNDNIYWTFFLEDFVRTDSVSEVQKLQSHGRAIYILSGDKQKRVDQLAATVGLGPERALGNLSPDQKHEFVLKSSHMAMVGDGANDALALSQASVGMAVYGSAEVGLRAADIFLTRPGLHLVNVSLRLGQQTMRLVKRNIGFSISYNIVGASAAILGYVSPLWAAVFMPLSSLTVLASTIIGTNMKVQYIKTDEYQATERVES